jgi:Tfp pilus assembly protein PilV
MKVYSRPATKRGGSVFLEVLISLLILAAVSAAFFAAMGTANKSVSANDQDQTSKNLAEMQIEYLKGLPYASAYTPAAIPADYPGYSVQTGVDGQIHAQSVPGRDSNIQSVSVTILHNGQSEMTLSVYKVR